MRFVPRAYFFFLSLGARRRGGREPGIFRGPNRSHARLFVRARRDTRAFDQSERD